MAELLAWLGQEETDADSCLYCDEKSMREGLCADHPFALWCARNSKLLKPLCNLHFWNHRIEHRCRIKACQSPVALFEILDSLSANQRYHLLRPDGAFPHNFFHCQRLPVPCRHPYCSTPARTHEPLRLYDHGLIKPFCWHHLYDLGAPSPPLPPPAIAAWTTSPSPHLSLLKRLLGPEIGTRVAFWAEADASFDDRSDKGMLCAVQGCDLECIGALSSLGKDLDAVVRERGFGISHDEFHAVYGAAAMCHHPMCHPVRYFDRGLEVKSVFIHRPQYCLWHAWTLESTKCRVADCGAAAVSSVSFCVSHLPLAHEALRLSQQRRHETTLRLLQQRRPVREPAPQTPVVLKAESGVDAICQMAQLADRLASRFSLPPLRDEYEHEAVLPRIYDRVTGNLREQ